MISLYITVYEKGQREQGKESSYGKEMNWPCPPAGEARVFVSDIGTVIRRIAFYTDGNIYVECDIKECREEYDSICNTMIAEGFTMQ